MKHSDWLTAAGWTIYTSSFRLERQIYSDVNYKTSFSPGFVSSLFSTTEVNVSKQLRMHRSGIGSSTIRATAMVLDP